MKLHSHHGPEHHLERSLNHGAGVLTKLDIMDPGTDARAVLDGQAVKLRHGWTAVVNRGPQHINADVQQDVRLQSSRCMTWTMVMRHGMRCT